MKHSLAIALALAFLIAPLAGQAQTVTFCGKSYGPETTKVMCRYLGVRDLSPLKGLTKLEKLIIGAQVNDLRPLKGLTNLKLLYLQNTKVTGAQVAALKKALPKLKIRRISSRP
jgi:hypothetical protein